MTYTDTIQIRDDESPPCTWKPREEKMFNLLHFSSQHSIFLSVFQQEKWENCHTTLVGFFVETAICIIIKWYICSLIYLELKAIRKEDKMMRDLSCEEEIRFRTKLRSWCNYYYLHGKPARSKSFVSCRLCRRTASKNHDFQTIYDLWLDVGPTQQSWASSSKPN